MRVRARARHVRSSARRSVPLHHDDDDDDDDARRSGERLAL
jgi:hypothetical protein